MGLLLDVLEFDLFFRANNYQFTSNIIIYHPLKTESHLMMRYAKNTAKTKFKELIKTETPKNYQYKFYKRRDLTSTQNCERI